MFDAKTLGWIQIVGALIAGWIDWQATGRFSAVLVLSIVFLLMGFSNVSLAGGSKKRRR